MIKFDWNGKLFLIFSHFSEFFKIVYFIFRVIVLSDILYVFNKFKILMNEIIKSF